MQAEKLFEWPYEVLYARVLFTLYMSNVWEIIAGQPTFNQGAQDNFAVRSLNQNQELFLVLRHPHEQGLSAFQIFLRIGEGHARLLGLQLIAAKDGSELRCVTYSTDEKAIQVRDALFDAIEEWGRDTSPKSNETPPILGMPPAWQEYSELLRKGMDPAVIARTKGIAATSVNQEITRARREYGEELFPKATARKAIRLKSAQ